MCRIFAFLSVKKILLEDVLKHPRNAVSKQIVMDWDDTDFYQVDGFGFSWYTDARSKFSVSDEAKKALEMVESDGDRLTAGRPRPATYKTLNAMPHNDPCFMTITANTSSRCIMAHMRAATSPPVATTNCHPFVFGRHSFMYNGGIFEFGKIRQDIIKEVSPDFTALIWGSTDTEHLAALYMTELCRTTGRTENGPDEDYEVEDMWRALKWAIRKVEEIQGNHGLTSPDNVFNVCAADGNSLVALCYRTEPADPSQKKHGWKDIPLWVTVNAADTLNLHSLPPSYVNKVVAEKVQQTKAVRAVVREIQDNAEDAFKQEAGNIIIHPKILAGIERQENDKVLSHGPHVIVSSEPTTIAVGAEWYKLSNKQAVLVDVLEKVEPSVQGQKGKKIRTVEFSADTF